MSLLRWRREDDPSGWSEVHPLPEVNAGLTEATRYRFESGDSSSALLIDDEPVPKAGTEGSWLWSPRFFAGEVRGELLGAQPITFALDVGPDPGKLGRKVFGAMVDELWADDPALVIGSEPAVRRIGDMGDTQDPWLEFERFRRYVPEFLLATAAVSARPRRALRVRRAARPPQHVRRVDRRTALALSSCPAVASAVVGLDFAAGVLAPGETLDVPLVDETLDAAANRAMLALLLALLRRGSALRDRLARLVEREAASETETPLSNRWPVRREALARLTNRLKRLLRQSPFTDVQRAELSAAGLTAVAADPAYSRAWNRGWRALRHGVDASPTDERLWISPSWQIYERWCFLRLARLLANQAKDWNWQRDPVTLRWDGSRRGRSACLEYQPTFRCKPGGSSGPWSVSREREPDIVLSVTGPGPGDAAFVVFDAKYRASRSNVLEAMASAHVYQDSLRLGSRRPAASLLLAPRGGGAPWLESLAFQAEHRVGVIPLSPDTEPLLPAAAAEALV